MFVPTTSTSSLINEPVDFTLLKKWEFGYYYFNNITNRRRIMEYKVVSGRGWTPDSAVKELEKRLMI